VYYLIEGNIDIVDVRHNIQCSIIGDIAIIDIRYNIRCRYSRETTDNACIVFSSHVCI